MYNPYLPRRRGRRNRDIISSYSYLPKQGRRRKRKRPGLLESLVRAMFRRRPDDSGTERAIRARTTANRPD